MNIVKLISYPIYLTAAFVFNLIRDIEIALCYIY
jgi:hypothetical protein